MPEERRQHPDLSGLQDKKAEGSKLNESNSPLERG